MNKKIQKTAIAALAVMTLAGSTAALGLSVDNSFLPAIVAEAATTSSTVQTTLKNTSTIDNNKVVKGGTVTINLAAKGGTSGYNYSVQYRKSSTSTWTTVTNQTGNKRTVTLASPTLYDIKVTVTDKAGTSKSKMFMAQAYKEGYTSNNVASGCVIGTKKSISYNGAKIDYIISNNSAYIYKITLLESNKNNILYIPLDLEDIPVTYIDKGVITRNKYSENLKSICMSSKNLRTVNIHRDAFKLRDNSLTDSFINNYETYNVNTRLVTVLYDKNGNRAYNYNNSFSDALPSLYKVSCINSTVIANGIFKNSKLKYVEISHSSNIHSCVIEDNAFENCTNLYSVVIPDIFKIGEYAFSNTTNLKLITITDQISKNVLINKYAFANSNIYIIDLKNDCLYNDMDIHIEANAFKNCRNINLHEKLLDNITYIGNSAFLNCENLQAHSFEKLQTIGRSAFKNCKKLTEITINKNANTSGNDIITDIGSQAFANCDNLKYIYIDRVKYIESSAFENCTKLTEISMNKNIKSSDNLFVNIGNSAFENCTNLQYVNAYESIINNIESKAFKNCNSLYILNCNDIRYYIGSEAFMNCNKLISLSKDDTINATTIDNYAFADCINLERIKLPNIKYIGDYSFNNCKRLTYVELNISNLNSIGKYAFYNCNKLKDIYDSNISSNKKHTYIIGNSAFKNCTELRYANIINNASKIGNNAFENCDKLDGIYLNKINYIGSKAFYNCTNMNYVCIDPTNLYNIGDMAFYNCINMELDVHYATGDESKYNITFGKDIFKNDLNIDANEIYKLTQRNENTFKEVCDPMIILNNTKINTKNIYLGQVETFYVKNPYDKTLDTVKYTVQYKRPNSSSWKTLNIKDNGSYKIKPTSEGDILVRVIITATQNGKKYTSTKNTSFNVSMPTNA